MYLYVFDVCIINYNSDNIVLLTNWCVLERSFLFKIFMLCYNNFQCECIYVKKVIIRNGITKICLDITQNCDLKNLIFFSDSLPYYSILFFFLFSAWLKVNNLLSVPQLFSTLCRWIFFPHMHMLEYNSALLLFSH